METWKALMLLGGGLFAGGAATFAWSRVPIWRRMPVAEFVRDFDQTIRWTDKVQPALLVVAIASAIAFAVTANGVARLLALLGAAGFVVVLLASLGFLVPLQRRIVSTPQDEQEHIEAMRRRWFKGNLGRSLLAVVSFALVVVAAVV